MHYLQTETLQQYLSIPQWYADIHEANYLASWLRKATGWIFLLGREHLWVLLPTVYSFWSSRSSFQDGQLTSWDSGGGESPDAFLTTALPLSPALIIIPTLLALDCVYCLPWHHLPSRDYEHNNLCMLCAQTTNGWPINNSGIYKENVFNSSQLVTSSPHARP